MKTVYGVWSGEYSSKVQHCLFESEADARSYINAIAAAQRKYNKSSKWGSENSVAYYASQYYIVPFQVWDSVPVVKLDEYGDVNDDD